MNHVSHVEYSRGDWGYDEDTYKKNSDAMASNACLSNVYIVVGCLQRIAASLERLTILLDPKAKSEEDARRERQARWHRMVNATEACRRRIGLGAGLPVCRAIIDACQRPDPDTTDAEANAYIARVAAVSPLEVARHVRFREGSKTHEKLRALFAAHGRDFDAERKGGKP